MSTADVSGAPDFHFDSLDAREVSSDAFRGRPAVLVFVDTSSLYAQSLVSELVALAPTLPNVSFALVALEDPTQRELVELYRDSMKVKFPTALADPGTRAGGGPLGDVHVVPTVIVLARDGRIAWRYTGPLRGADVRAHVKNL
jgi:hypothetical protein